MISWLLKYIATKYITNVSGKSASNGFMLRISEYNGLEFDDKVFSTSEYDANNCSLVKSEEEFDKKYFKLIYLLYFIFEPAISVVLIFYLSKINFLIKILILPLIIVLPFCVLIIFISLIPFFLNQKAKKWHALEHMLANLIIQKQDITLENIKKIKKTNILCGNSITFAILLSETSSIIILLNLIFSFNNIFLLITVFIMISSTALLTSLLTAIFWQRKKYFFLLILSVIISIPTLIFAICFQRIFFLKNPSEEKLLQTIEDFKLFSAKNNLN